MLGRVLYIKDDQKTLKLFLNTTFWLRVWAMGWCMTCVYQNCTSCVWNRKSSTSQRSWVLIFLQGINDIYSLFFIITAILGQIKSLVFCCLIVSLSLSLHSSAVPFLRLDSAFLEETLHSLFTQHLQGGAQDNSHRWWEKRQSRKRKVGPAWQLNNDTAQ